MKHFPAIIILVAYLLLATSYSVVTPLGEGPDEPGHAAYVFFLAREYRLPDQRANEVPGEGHQPPLAYALAVPMVLWLPQEARTFDLPGNPRFVWAGGNQTNAVAHGSREHWPWQGEVLAWHLARLVSVASGVVTVAMTYVIARGIQHTGFSIPNGPNRVGMPLLAASLVAFNPQFLFISGLVSNDALLAALSATALWLSVRVAHGLEHSARVSMVLGLVLGLALLAKQSAVVLVPMALLATALNARRQGGRSSFVLQKVLFAWTLMLLSAGLASGWWYMRNWQLYGDLFGLRMFQAEFTTQPFDRWSFAAWRDGLVQLHSSFWARFGWMNIAPPDWVIAVFTGIEVVALAGWGLVVKRRAQSAERRTANLEQWVLVGMLVLTTIGWLVAFALTTGLVAWQGRLLFPALAAIAILLAAGMNEVVHGVELIVNSRRSDDRRSSLFILHSSLFVLALWLPFGIIRPAYGFETLPERVALARLGTLLKVRFAPAGEPGAELRGWTLVGTPRPGETLQLALRWHALGRQNRDWTVFVHLVNARDEIVAESNAEPRNGAFPMRQWVLGDWVEDTHFITLPPTLLPGNYTLRMGLFDAQGTQERTGVWNPAGELVGDYLELGTIDVTR